MYFLILFCLSPLIIVQGTWRFLSIGHLRDPNKVHERFDDFEAVFWAFLYGASQCYENESQCFTPASIFDEVGLTLIPGGSVATGGWGKLTLLAHISASIRFTSTALNTLIDDIAGMLHGYYGRGDGMTYYKNDGTLGVMNEENRAKLHKKLSDATTWEGLFDQALAQDQGWAQEDVVNKDTDTPESVQTALRNIQMYLQSTTVSLTSANY